MFAYSALTCAVIWWLAAGPLHHHRLAEAISRHPIVCVMAFDGFRPDYIYRGRTPTLERLRNDGVRTEYMTNVFPTKTFVNFFSMATGMYARKHGVLGNKVFNEKNQCIGYGYEMFHYNAAITPIWILNEMSGDGRHSGVMMWAGEQFEYRNVTPTFSEPYKEKTPWNDRVDRVVEWLTHDRTPANLVYMYFEQPDSASHKFGTDSKNVTYQLKRIDLIIEYFLKKLSQHELYSKVNLIILSDHGMANIDSEHVIDMDTILDPTSYNVCGGSPVLQLQLKKGYEDEGYKNLTRARNKMKTFEVYKKHEIPERWYYQGTKRVTDLLLVANLPYAFNDEKNKADHGYDNAEPLMHAFFTAIGPLFKEKYWIKELQNIDIYALIAYIMQMDTSKLLVKPDAVLTNIMSILKANVWEDFKNRNKQKILKYFVPKRTRNHKHTNQAVFT